MMKKQHLIFLFVFIALLPILLLRDFTPANELKYLSIAEEAIENGHIFAFYNHGVPYADKPPLYLWIVMLGKVLWGKHVMFFLSLFSFIPALLTVCVMNRWVNHERKSDEAFNSMMLLTAGFFLGCAFFLRMDMLMTLFITLSVYMFYRMYRYNNRGEGSEKQYRKWRILLPVYTFMAIFTKGAVGIMVPLMAIPVFLLINRKIRTIGKYIGWRFWAILAAFCAVWFTGVYLDGGTAYLNDLLFNQTINRAVDSFHHKEAFYYYFITYWYALAPWSIAVAAAIIIGFRKRLIQGDMMRLLAVTALGTLVMMSCVSSKIVIYMLPAFPFFAYLGALLIQEIRHSLWIGISVGIPAAIFALTLPAAIFAEAKGLLPLQLWAPAWILVLPMAAGGIYAIWSLIKKNTPKAIMALGCALLVTVSAASLSIRSLNDIIGWHNACEYAKSEAAALEKSSGEKAAIGYYSFSLGQNLDVYLGKDIVRFENGQLEGAEHAVLFVKERQFRRDSVLRNRLGDCPRKIFGPYSVVTVK